MGRDRSRLIGSATGTARAAIVVIPGAFLLAFFVYPVTTILARGLATDGFDPFTDLFGSARTRGVIWFTVWQAAVSTLLTLAVALPGAAVLARRRRVPSPSTAGSEGAHCASESNELGAEAAPAPLTEPIPPPQHGKLLQASHAVDRPRSTRT